MCGYKIAGQFGWNSTMSKYLFRRPLIHFSQHKGTTEMEDDRAQVDLGIAANIEEKQEEAAQRQPKKRFVGRKAATEAASRNGANSNVEDTGAVQGR